MAILFDSQYSKIRKKILECATIWLIISYLKLFIHLIYTSFTIVVFIDVHGKSRVAALPRIFHPLNWRFRGFQMRVSINFNTVSHKLLKGVHRIVSLFYPFFHDLIVEVWKIGCNFAVYLKQQKYKNANV